jgi:hypothetical protein
VKKPGHVYQFNLRLLGVAPPIWRRVQVPEPYSFWDLHVALQDSMGWLDYHLHLFRVTKPVAGEVVQIGILDDDALEGDELILPGWKIPSPTTFPTRVSSLNTIGQLGYEVLFLRMGPLFIVGAVFLLAYSVLFLVAAGIAAHLRRRFGSGTAHA